MNKPVSMSPSKVSAKAVIKLTYWQFIMATVMATIAYFVFDLYVALSVLLGGFVAGLSNLFFAGRLATTNLCVSDEENAQILLQRFYRSEVMKIVFTVSMLAICILVLKVSILAFIISYLICALIVNWLFLLVDS